jgi:hypothetical protein
VNSGIDGSGDGSAAGPPEVFIGDLDDYVLPFCQPTEGVICSGELAVSSLPVLQPRCRSVMDTLYCVQHRWEVSITVKYE